MLKPSFRVMMDSFLKFLYILFTILNLRHSHRNHFLTPRFDFDCSQIWNKCKLFMRWIQIGAELRKLSYDLFVCFPSTIPSAKKTLRIVPKKHFTSIKGPIFLVYSPSSLAFSTIPSSSLPLI